MRIQSLKNLLQLPGKAIKSISKSAFKNTNKLGRSVSRILKGGFISRKKRGTQKRK